MKKKSPANCPVCDNGSTSILKEIKSQPVLCNSLFRSRTAALGAPMGDIVLTLCRSCGHVFNSAFEPEAIRYDGDYENSLHYSGVFQGYAAGLASRLVKKYPLSGKHIVEIGCGKGDFLGMICDEAGSTGTGFDSSYEGGRVKTDSRIEFVKEAYNGARSGVKGDLVVARHVLEHVPSPRDFCLSLKQALKDDGRLFIEVPDSNAILNKNGIWDIIYEHYSYFSETSLRSLLESCGLHVHDIYRTFNDQFLCAEASMNGAGKGKSPSGSAAPQVPGNESFGKTYSEIFESWKNILSEFAKKGRTGALWGAGSKGVTFLNVTGARNEIGCVVDINPNKKGKFIPGTGHLVVQPGSLARMNCPAASSEVSRPYSGRSRPKGRGMDPLKKFNPDFIIIMNRAYTSEIEKMLAGLCLKTEMLHA